MSLSGAVTNTHVHSEGIEPIEFTLVSERLIELFSLNSEPVSSNEQ